MGVRTTSYILVKYEKVKMYGVRFGCCCLLPGSKSTTQKLPYELRSDITYSENMAVI